ncbi:MAG: hypothetical protein ACTSQK_01185 [Candidatus Heimdallarchaeota archaeon]
MATEIQWQFITDKYSIVDYLDRSIVVARFNQKDLMRDLIELRGKFLESKTYEDLVSYLDILNTIFENSTDKRLSEILSNLIDQVSSFREERFDIKKSTKEVETRVID